MGQKEVLDFLASMPKKYFSAKEIEVGTSMHFTNVYSCLEKLHTQGEVTIQYIQNGTKKKLRAYKMVEKSENSLQEVVEEFNQLRAHHRDISTQILSNLFVVKAIREVQQCQKE